MPFYLLLLLFTFSTCYLFAIGDISEDKVINFWPLFSYTANEKEHRKDLEFLGAIFERDISTTSSLLAVRPFFSTISSEDAKNKIKQTDILWPFITYKHNKKLATAEGSHAPLEYYKFEFIPLIFWSKFYFPDETVSRFILFPIIYSKYVSPESNYFIVFPFYWQAKDSSVYFPLFWKSKKDFFAIFPIYGRFYDLWGNDKTTFYFWPLYTHTKKGAVNSYSFPFPIFRVVAGGGEKGVRIWPLIGYREKKGVEKKMFYVWPLGYYFKTKLNTDNPDYLKAFFPLFWDIKINDAYYKNYFLLSSKTVSPIRTVTSYITPIYTHINNHKEKYTEHQFFWFLVKIRKGENQKKVSIFPFYGIEKKPNQQKDYILWPVISKREKTEKKYYKKETYITPVYFSKYKKNLVTGKEEKRIFVLPLYSKKKYEDGSVKFSLLWPLWYDESSEVERNYAVLWRVYTRETKPNGDVEKNLLGGLYKSTENKKSIKSEWNFLFLHHKNEKNK